jgi:hypothetical protein
MQGEGGIPSSAVDTTAVSDAYGFPLRLTPAQEGERLDAARLEAANDKAWRQALAAERDGKLPPAPKLKKLIRKVVPSSG